jgi:hypothetical protein
MGYHETKEELKPLKQLFIKDYLDEGFVLIPIPYGKKVGFDDKNKEWKTKAPPKVKGWQKLTSADMTDNYVNQYFSDCENIATQTGIPYDDGFLFVIDVDIKDGKNGTDDLNTLFNHQIPKTRMQITPTGGLHYFFKSKQPLKITRSGKNGLDFRGVGGMVMLAPSNVVYSDYSIKYYEIDNDEPIAYLPDEVETHLINTYISRPVKKYAPVYSPGERDQKLPKLKRLADGGYFQTYDDWIRVAMAMHASGYEFEDFAYITTGQDEKMLRAKWESFGNREGITSRTLQHYISEYYRIAADELLKIKKRSSRWSKN